MQAKPTLRDAFSMYTARGGGGGGGTEDIFKRGNLPSRVLTRKAKCNQRFTDFCEIKIGKEQDKN